MSDQSTSAPPTIGKEIMLERMTWPEIAERQKTCDIVLVPVGSNEQHGPHLPVCDDWLAALEFCRVVARQVVDDLGCLVAPVIAFGLTGYRYPGTIGFSRETVIRMYKEISTQLLAGGFRKVVLVNCHGGNTLPLKVAMNEVAAETGGLVALFQWWEVARPLMRQIMEGPNAGEGHGGEAPASFSWALGQKVRDHLRIPVNVPRHPALRDFFASSTAGPGLTVAYTHYTDRDWLTPGQGPGHMGNAALASPEKGRLLVEYCSAELARFLRAIKDLDVQLDPAFTMPVRGHGGH